MDTPSPSTTAASRRGASWLVATSVVARLPLARQPHATPLVADAFGTACWVAVGLIAAGLAPALLLARTKPEQQTEQTAEVARDKHAARLPPRFLSFGRP
jgi:hypothetical protein